jgi:hypothetical protein
MRHQISSGALNSFAEILLIMIGDLGSSDDTVNVFLRSHVEPPISRETLSRSQFEQMRRGHMSRSEEFQQRNQDHKI